MNILADGETQLSDKLNQFLHSPARSGLGTRAITIPIRLRMIHYHDTSSSSSSSQAGHRNQFYQKGAKSASSYLHLQYHSVSF